MKKAKTKRRPRLKRNPEIQDYVVEETFLEGGYSQAFTYFMKRVDARDYAKASYADFVRTFRIRYHLVGKRVK